MKKQRLAIPALLFFCAASHAATTTQICDNATSSNCSRLTNASAAINISMATTTTLVGISAIKVIYLTEANAVSADTDNIRFEHGTGATCGSGTTVLTGAYDLTAQAGFAIGDGVEAQWVIPSANALCALTTASVQMSGSVSYNLTAP